jgi:hypothetical protein
MTFNVNGKAFCRIIAVSLKDLFSVVLCSALFGFFRIAGTNWCLRKSSLFGRMSCAICSILLQVR